MLFLPILTQINDHSWKTSLHLPDTLKTFATTLGWPITTRLFRLALLLHVSQNVTKSCLKNDPQSFFLVLAIKKYYRTFSPPIQMYRNDYVEFAHGINVMLARISANINYLEEGSNPNDRNKFVSLCIFSWP